MSSIPDFTPGEVVSSYTTDLRVVKGAGSSAGRYAVMRQDRLLYETDDYRDADETAFLFAITSGRLV